MIQDQAMLVNLSISLWRARKLDRKVTAETNAAHGAKSSASRTNKLLIEHPSLKAIATAGGELREVHNKYTLAWGDNGDRLLVSKLLFEYGKQLRTAEEKFWAAVNVFKPLYPVLKQAARNDLGTMYDPSDYPDDISDKFSVRKNVAPVPKAGDFRVDVGVKDLDRLRREIEDTIKEREENSVKECYARIRIEVKRYSERLRDPKSKVFQSMIDDAKDMVNLIPAFNITSDPNLIAFTDEIKTRLLCANVTTLKTDLAKRAEITAAADDILTRLPCPSN